LDLIDISELICRFANNALLKPKDNKKNRTGGSFCFFLFIVIAKEAVMAC